MKTINDYIVVERLTGSDLYMNGFESESYQRCKVILTNENSLIKTGDELLVGDAISYDKASDFGTNCFFIYESQVFGIIREGKIIPMNNIIYVKTDKNRKQEVSLGELKIFNDTSYNPLAMNNVVQDGEVFTVCEQARDERTGKLLDLDIVPGDKVYTHHFLTDKGAEREFNGEMYYEILYENVYCKIVDGEIVMLNDWNFITPIKDDETELDGITLTVEEKNIAQTGIVEVANKSLGLEKGQKILFKNNREYEINVEGNTYYRIKNSDILYEL